MMEEISRGTPSSITNKESITTQHNVRNLATNTNKAEETNASLKKSRGDPALTISPPTGPAESPQKTTEKAATTGKFVVAGGGDIIGPEDSPTDAHTPDC